MKLCIIYNFAQHYRSEIFQLIGETFDCDWLFGDSMGDVKKMDYSLLNGDIKETHTQRLFGGWYWQPGVISKLGGKYTHYILLGETRALSTWLFCILSRLFYPQKKVYFWSHGWYGKETTLERLVKKILFHLPNGGIFLYGNYARELMIKEGFNPNKLYVIHNSLAYSKQLKTRKNLSNEDIYREHFGNEYPMLLFVGRLTKVKRLDMLVRAVKMAADNDRPVNLILIGTGEQREELQKMVRDFGIEQYVWFYGASYNEEELSRLIYNADLCVAPGNVGLTAMHALVYGCPVVTHNNFKEQMPEFEAIKAGRTGDFFEQNDVDSLYRTICSWLEQHKDRDEVRKEAYKEIDSKWNPHVQLQVIRKALGV